MSSRRLMNRSLSSDGRSYCSGYSDISSQSRRAGCRSYLSSVRSESRSTLCSVMAQLTEEIQPTFESTLKSKAVSEDANVKFSCVVSGYPVPEVTWYKDDIQMDRYCGRPKYEISRDDKTHTLQIYNCTLDDAAIYQASAQNSRGIVSCSGVLEVGTMSEYKIHQNYFTKLKQRNENRRREQEQPRNTGTETVPAASVHVRMSSPKGLQRKRGAESPSEDRVVEVDGLDQTPPLEERLCAPIQEPEAAPVHGNSEVITNREKDEQELTYIHDTVNIGTSKQINEYVKKKVKISTERSKENRLNGMSEEMDVQTESVTEHRNKMDTQQNEKLSVKADKSGSEETKTTLSRKKAEKRSENQSLKLNKCASEESKRAHGALINSVTESRNKMEITDTKTTDKQLLTMNKSASRELKAAQGHQVAEVTETTNKKDVNSKINEQQPLKVNKKNSEELKSAQMAPVNECRTITDRKATEKLSEKVNKSALEDTKRDQGTLIASLTETRNKMVNKTDARNNENQSVNLNKSTSDVSKRDLNAQVASVTESRNKMDLKVTKTNFQQQRSVMANKRATEETTQGALITSVTKSRDKMDITDTKTNELSKKVNKSVSEQSKRTQMASVIESKNKMDISDIKKNENQSENVNKSASQGDQIGSVTEHKNIMDITDTRKSLVTANTRTKVLEESKRAQNPQIDSVTESKAKVDVKDTLKREKLQVNANKIVFKGSNKAQCAQIDSVTEPKVKTGVTDTKTNANKPVHGESKKAQGVSKASVTASKAKVDVTDTNINETQSENMKEMASEAKKILKPIGVVENTKSTQPSDTQLQALDSFQNCNLTHTVNKHVDFNGHGNRNPVDTRVRILPHSCGGNDVNVYTGDRNVSGSSLRASAAADTQTEPTEPPIPEDVPPPHKEVAKELKEQPTLMREVNASSSVTETLYSCHPASQEQKLTAGDQSAASTKSSTLVTDTQPSDKISSGHVSHKLQGGQVTTATRPSLGDDTLTNTCTKESKAENQLIKESDKPKREIKPASMSQNNMDENEMQKSIKTNVQSCTSKEKSNHSTTQVIVTESIQIQQKTTNGSSIKECESTSHVATDNVVKMNIKEQSNVATSEVPKSTYEMQIYSGPSTFLSQHSKALATEFTIPAIYITDVDSTSQNSTEGTVEISTEANGETSNVKNISKCIESLCNNEKSDLSQRSQLSEVNKRVQQENLTQGPESSNHCSAESVASGFNRQKEVSMQRQNVDKSISEYDVTQTGNFVKTDLKTDSGSFIKHLRSAALDLEMSNQCSTGAPHANSQDNNKHVEKVSSAAIQTEACKVTIPLKTTNSQVFNSTAEPATSTGQKTTFSSIKTDKSETGMAKCLEEENQDTYQGDKLSLKSQPASPITQSVSNSPLTTLLETQSPRLTRRTVQTDQPKPVGNENIKPKSTEKDKENQFKVPQVIRKIRPEVFDASGHLKLWCQFFNIVSDSTIRWFKDEVEIAEIKRSAGDEAQVCLAIIRMSKRDCGIYRCAISNEYGKDSTEYHLSSEFLSNMFMREELQEVGEEIEMTPLIFSKGLADAGCWGSKFYGRVTTEEAQVGLGCEHKTRRLKVIYGLDPVFESGSSCFMKVRSPIAYESREETVLAERNLQITKQDCRIQNMAREYFKIFAAETRVIESFGAALEVIPLYFTYWPASSVPYATVEAELKGVYLRYCGLDRTGSLVINEKSEVGQKCSSLQHWIHQWTSGNVLFSRIEGVDTILTNIGIAVRSKGYQGFPCEANPQVFEQFQIQHQCNYFCGLLKLRSLKAPETLQTPARSKGSSSPLLQRKTAASSSSPQTSRKATKSPKLSRKLNPQTSS